MDVRRQLRSHDLYLTMPNYCSPPIQHADRHQLREDHPELWGVEQSSVAHTNHPRIHLHRKEIFSSLLFGIDCHQWSKLKASPIWHFGGNFPRTRLQAGENIAKGEWWYCRLRWRLINIDSSRLERLEAYIQSIGGSASRQRRCQWASSWEAFEIEVKEAQLLRTMCK